VLNGHFEVTIDGYKRCMQNILISFRLSNNIFRCFYLEYDEPDGDNDEFGIVKPGDARLGLTLGHWCPGGGVLDAAVSASDHIFGLVGGSGIPQSWW